MSAAGAPPRPVRRWTSRRLLSGIQRMPAVTVLSGWSSSLRALRAPTSTSHSSLPPVSGSCWLSAMYFWSGDQDMPASESGLGRPSMRCSLPVATSISHRSVPKVKRLGE